MTITVLVQWDSFVVPRFGRQSHHHLLLLVERMGLVVDDDPRPRRVVIRFERIRYEDDVSAFEVVERWSSAGHDCFLSSSSVACSHSSRLSAPSVSSGNVAVELNIIAS
jgi:hypothetical protein